MNENAKKWVEALESGEYKQTFSRLASTYGGYGQSAPVSFCCLGVACELAFREGLVTRTVDNGQVSYDNNISRLPRNVADWLGLVDENGGYLNDNEAPTSLALRNDRGDSFEKIAQIIRSEPKELFKA